MATSYSTTKLSLLVKNMLVYPLYVGIGLHVPALGWSFRFLSRFHTPVPQLPHHLGPGASAEHLTVVIAHISFLYLTIIKETLVTTPSSVCLPKIELPALHQSLLFFRQGEDVRPELTLTHSVQGVIRGDLAVAIEEAWHLTL